MDKGVAVGMIFMNVVKGTTVSSNAVDVETIVL